MKIASGAADGHQRVVDGEPLERLQPLRLLVVLAHRHPRVGVHDVGAGDGVDRPVVERDRRRCRPARDVRARRRRGRSPAGRPTTPRRRASWRSRRASGRRCCSHRPRRRGDPSASRARPPSSGRRRSPATGATRSDSRLTIGTSATAAMRCEHAVVEHPRGDHRVVALEDPHDVLGGLAGVDAHFLTAGVHGMTAELDDGDLGRVTRARRRLLEDQRHAAAVERSAEVRRIAAGEVEHGDHLVGREVGDVEQVAAESDALIRAPP